MSKDIREYLHYYLGCEVAELPKGKHDGMLIDRMTSVNEGGSINVSNGYFMEPGKFKPILRKLESMTEEEMVGLLLSMWPPEIDGKPDNDEYNLEMFYNDGGNMVDGDIAVGANYTCRCYEGQIAVRKTGDVDLFDEDGEQAKLINRPASFHYLLSRGFWIFGNDWFDEGYIIDKATLK